MAAVARLFCLDAYIIFSVRSLKWQYPSRTITDFYSVSLLLSICVRLIFLLNVNSLSKITSQMAGIFTRRCGWLGRSYIQPNYFAHTGRNHRYLYLWSRLCNIRISAAGSTDFFYYTLLLRSCYEISPINTEEENKGWKVYYRFFSWVINFFYHSHYYARVATRP